MIEIILLSLICLCHSQQCTTKCYFTNETLTAGGAHSCIDDCNCWSIRTCSTHGWCQGVDTYHDPPDCATTTTTTTAATTTTTTTTTTISPTTISPTTISPTPSPTTNPTAAPTDVPTKYPTAAPTSNPTPSPTKDPTASPTTNPSLLPTYIPTNNPTFNPTKTVTGNPTESPTTLYPTKTPHQNPDTPATKHPTESPTDSPTKSSVAENEQREYGSTINTEANNKEDSNHSDKKSNIFSDDFLLSQWYLLVGVALTFLCCLCIIALCIMYKMKKKQQKQRVSETNITDTKKDNVLQMQRVLSMSSTNACDIEMIQTDQTPKSLSIQPTPIMSVMITPMGLTEYNNNNKSINIAPLSLDANTFDAGEMDGNNNVVTDNGMNTENDMRNEEEHNAVYDESDRTKGGAKENENNNDDEYEYYYEDEEEDNEATDTEELYLSDPNKNNINVEITPQ